MLRNQFSSFIAILAVMLFVFLLNMTFSVYIPVLLLMTIRAGLTIIFLILWKSFQKNKLQSIQNFLFSLMVVNLSFLIVSFFTTSFWNLNLETPAGIAFAKLSDSFFISLVILLSFLIGKFSLKDLFITKGRLVKGLLIGISSFSLMAFLAINNPEHPMELAFIKRNLIWILIFVFSNAFMEELLFRGIFIKHLNKLINSKWSILLTAIVFAASHLQVSYTQELLFFTAILLILGVIWGFLIQYTKSLIASILFHAGADLLIILPIYANFGVNL